MDDHCRNTLTHRLRWLPNVAILAGMAGIAWWGHTYHWTLPSLSGVDKSPTAASLTAPESSATSSSATPSVQRLFPSTLPAIEFASAEAAHNCGIEFASVEKHSMDDVVVTHGRMGYDQTRIAQLSVRAPGIVWRAEKRVGDYVERGDILAIVDAADVGQAKANLLEAAVLYRLKSQEFERLQGLKTIIPERELIAAEAAREVSRTQRFNAMQKLVNLGFHLRLSEIESMSADELAEHLHLLGLPASLDPETASANLIPLKAPFAGVVINCEIVRGELVDSTKPQYVIADTSRMWINLDIRQEDAARLKLGTTVMFTQQGETRPVPGVLTWIGTEVDAHSRLVRARAEVDNPFLDDRQTDPGARRSLQAGAFGSAQIVIGIRPEVLVVPNNAVRWQWEIGRELVFVPSEDGKRFTPRVVSKGLVRDGRMQVTEGLQAGEQVVTSGSRVLSSELSEMLQPRLGDNASAVREFNGITKAAASSPR